MTTSFAELGLNEHILRGVESLGFNEPTPVQAQAIPVILSGRDVVASAQTGTGKTAAFAFPTLQLVAQYAPAPEAAPAPDAAPAAGESPDSDAASPEPLSPSARRRRRRRKGGASSEGSPDGTPGAQPGQPGQPGRSGKSGKSGSGQPAKPYGPLALVVTPTRELAQQIDKVASAVAQATGQRVVTVIGGERYDRQIKGLKRGCDMLVATPGRLIDLLERKEADLSQVRVLVLDEADRMLDMGFWPSVRKIIVRLPRERQTLLFSATISGDILSSMPTMMSDPVNIEISRVGETAATVEQRLVPVTQGQKVSLLTHLIERDKPARVLIFCRTKQRVDSVAGALERAGLKVGVMHADRRQREREKALDGFRSGELEALVATDVMSRGIDVSGIDWVVNFDVPLDPEDYVHRIGRTGRAGHAGVAFTFLAPDEVSPLREIEYFTKALVPVWDPGDFEFAAGRIVPNEKRATSRTQRSLFSGSRSRGRGISGGRFGRHT